MVAACHSAALVARIAARRTARPVSSAAVTATDRTDRSPTSPGLAWDWSGALLGAAYAVPAALVVLNDPSKGVAMSVGVLPAAIIGLAPRRRGRLAVVLLGVLTGVPMLVGGLLSGVPVLAVAGIALWRSAPSSSPAARASGGS